MMSHPSPEGEGVIDGRFESRITELLLGISKIGMIYTWLEVQFQGKGFQLCFEANRPPYWTLLSEKRTTVEKNDEKSSFFRGFQKIKVP